MRDSFIFYRSFLNSIRHLDDAEQLQLYNAIVTYSLDQIEPELTRYAMAVWQAIKPQLDANHRKYEAGCKGGKPKPNQSVTKAEPSPNQRLTKVKPQANQDVTKTEPKPNLMYNVNDNDNVNDNVNENDFRNRNFKNELLADEMFCETFMMSKNCDRKELEKQVNDFETDLTLKDVEHSTFSKYKRHFANWVAYKNITQKPHWSHTISSEDRFYFDEHGTLPDGSLPY